MLKIGKKLKQQVLARKGLDYVTDTYLPERLERYRWGEDMDSKNLVELFEL